ncbi:uncharacterized protein LOC114291045 isoform X1 [Camellia sinensis]|uniref:uncharacterized protein LOC114291045 isoform X1 n=1 Tax=Camellia sinensis TaxID=4442 RepID=UPI001036E1CD|nr:uncharacterized protein LOC114291045 isoform X1 [Camellia sinensis]
MKSGLLTAHSLQFCGLAPTHHNPFLRTPSSSSSSSSSSSNPISVVTLRIKPSRSCWLTLCSSSIPSNSNTKSTTNQTEETSNPNLDVEENDTTQQNRWTVQVGSPTVPSLPMSKLSLSDQAFFLLAFIACTTSVAFMSLVTAAVPTLFAMRRAAISLSKLADTAREELPSTMAAIRLSGMEISDLTLELSDLSQEIADGVNKSAQAVQAAEAGIRKIGSFARQQTMSMIQERANLPTIPLQPVVAGAAMKTSRAVGHATKTFMNMISRGELGAENESENLADRLEI